MLRITVLMENKGAGKRLLRSEHGLSLLVEDGCHRVLFDCGQSAGFMENAAMLGIPLSDLEAVVLSHSHYDHAAGFRCFSQAGYRSPLYVGKGFFSGKYSRSGIKYTDLSAGWDESYARAHSLGLFTVEGEMAVCPGMTVFQGFERRHSGEQIPERFVREDGSIFIPDDFSDEILLAADTDEGLVLIVGCSHPGIMNMVDSVASRTGKRISAIIGGTHLGEADEARLDETLSYLHSSGISILGLCHCSGKRAEERASALFGEAAPSLAPGDVLIL